ncbi:flagellar basal body P-ring protein FlgI [Candidatus Saganbacteria bacterium]|nr:flagellar basal body P-ring protein FlgI [Candidatus Saganbacteria bacterium]
MAFLKNNYQVGIWDLVIGILILTISFPCYGTPSVRIKDIAHVLGARENQLMGFGLVVGLRNTGDTQQTGFTKQAMTNLLSKMGVAPQLDFNSRNIAAVMVTATLPPFVKSGQKIDITVSSMGDATSLAGGTLLLTPLQGPDSAVYASAQGNITVDQDILIPNLPPIRNSRSTAGRVPGGGLVEKEVPVTFSEKGGLSIVLDSPDFTTAGRIADAIAAAGYDARTFDAGTVKVTVFSQEDALAVIQKVENLTIVPDSVAKVVINERTGTIVMGENVKIAASAVSFSGINVSIGPVKLYSEGSSIDKSEINTLRTQTNANFKKSQKALTYVPQAARLVDLVRALNRIKATPQELIAILQALKKVGALKADLEII